MASSSVKSAAVEVPNNPRKSSNDSSGMDSETGRLLTSLCSVGSSLADVGTGLPDLPKTNESQDDDLFQVPASVPQQDFKLPTDDCKHPAAEVPKNPRKSSHDSSAMLNSLGSVSSSGFADVGTGLPDLPKALPDLPKVVVEPPDENQFQIPAAVPQHQLKLPADDSSLHVTFTRLQNPLEEGASLTCSKGSRNLPERRLPSKKRKMSYESYDSAMGDSYLGLASLDSGILPKLQADGASVNTKGSGASSSAQLPGLKVSALDHLDFLGDDANGLPAPAPVLTSKKPSEGEHAYTRGPTSERAGALASAADDNSNSEATFTSEGHRLLMEAIMMTSGGAGGLDSGGRKRLESWGGMSDLSVQMGPDRGVDAAAALAASALHHTGIFDDVTAAANFGGGSVASSVTDDHMLKLSAVETAPAGRDRKGSMASFSDSTLPVPSSLDGLEISSDLQKFVAAAVASVGDQLAELAGNMESAVEPNNKDEDTRQGSEVSSIATPLMLGAFVDDPSRITVSGQSSTQPINVDTNKNVEAAAASAAAISVDYDAVAAAVDAANAATGGLDLSAIMGEGAVPMSTTSSMSSGGGKIKRKRKLPTNRKATSTAASHFSMLGDVPKSSLSEKEQEEIRERARRAAGYVPPSQLPNFAIATPAKSRTLPPLKKRMKRMTPEPVASQGNSMVTPKISNTSANAQEKLPGTVSTTKAKATGSGKKEKSTAKWEGMYTALIEFVAERKREEMVGASEGEIAEWIWDGNVPTTYKTQDGKALGRWINNQRSAKSNGKLKEDREKRLVSAGLKWSVLASNSWNDMLDELKIYIKEYTKDGKKWDGNVPTNYRIKARSNGKKLSEEDKNLGRWVNRQRSLYQAGKLREDRQLALEKVGLKWSMLATTSWEAMFETLVAYVEDKKGIKWDGNVPANYRTDDSPPRALGRWINRQRSAHVKKKLKKEYVDRLTKLGLKWSVHDRKYDEPHSSAQIQPNGVASAAPTSCHKAQIPSTIAVPAKKEGLQDVIPAKVPSVRFDDSALKSVAKGDTPVATASNEKPASIEKPTKTTGDGTKAAIKPTSPCNQPCDQNSGLKPSPVLIVTTSKEVTAGDKGKPVKVAATTPSSSTVSSTKAAEAPRAPAGDNKCVPKAQKPVQKPSPIVSAPAEQSIVICDGGAASTIATTANGKSATQPVAKVAVAPTCKVVPVGTKTIGVSVARAGHLKTAPINNAFSNPPKDDKPKAVVASAGLKTAPINDVPANVPRDHKPSVVNAPSAKKSRAAGTCSGLKSTPENIATTTVPCTNKQKSGSKTAPIPTASVTAPNPAKPKAATPSPGPKTDPINKLSTNAPKDHKPMAVAASSGPKAAPIKNVSLNASNADNPKAAPASSGLKTAIIYSSATAPSARKPIVATASSGSKTAPIATAPNVAKPKTATAASQAGTVETPIDDESKPTTACSEASSGKEKPKAAVASSSALKTASTSIILVNSPSAHNLIATTISSGSKTAPITNPSANAPNFGMPNVATASSGLKTAPVNDPSANATSAAGLTLSVNTPNNKKSEAAKVVSQLGAGEAPIDDESKPTAAGSEASSGKKPEAAVASSSGLKTAGAHKKIAATVGSGSKTAPITDPSVKAPNAGMQKVSTATKTAQIRDVSADADKTKATAAGSEVSAGVAAEVPDAGKPDAADSESSTDAVEKVQSAAAPTAASSTVPVAAKSNADPKACQTDVPLLKKENDNSALTETDRKEAEAQVLQVDAAKDIAAVLIPSKPVAASAAPKSKDGVANVVRGPAVDKGAESAKSSNQTRSLRRLRTRRKS